VARTMGPRKGKQYSDECKVTAVQLSALEGVLIQDVARALDIHPFLVSRWRKEVREGKLVAKTKQIELEPQTVVELQRLWQVEREDRLVKEEHTLVKKALRFCSARRQKSSRSSTAAGRSRA
jgi:transposase